MIATCCKPRKKMYIIKMKLLSLNTDSSSTTKSQNTAYLNYIGTCKYVVLRYFSTTTNAASLICYVFYVNLINVHLRKKPG